MATTAQLVMLGHGRPDLDAETRRRLETHDLAGIFLYGDALGDSAQVRELTAEIQSLAHELPLFIAVDQEGGRVQAWGPPHQQPLPTAAEIGWDYEASKELLEVTVLAMDIGRQLAAAGINVDFAPVLDVHTNPDNPIIGDRSFASRPEIVAEVGCAFIDGLHAAGVLACGKHFPGHGDTDLDSHLALPTVSHDNQRLRTVELAPFGAAISRGLEMIMTAHVLYPAWDGERPATLSPYILGEILRDDLAFNGVVICDDLEMKGIRDEVDLLEAAIRALDAGCDVVLSVKEQQRHDLLLEALERAGRDRLIEPQRLRQSLERVVRVKHDGWIGQ